MEKWIFGGFAGFFFHRREGKSAAPGKKVRKCSPGKKPVFFFSGFSGGKEKKKNETNP